MVPTHKTDHDRENYVNRKKVLFGQLGMEQVSEIEAKVRDAYDKSSFGKFQEVSAPTQRATGRGFLAKGPKL